MKDTFEKRYYKEVDKKFNNIHKIGIVLGDLRCLKIDVKWKNEKTIQDQIQKIYNKLNEIEL
tara:strand:+ start:410 stop:595 length:186 start_codon:yes stop_codon:yes gene_type:complete